MNESLPFVKGSETSKAAAESMKEIAPSDEARVYALLEKAGSYGATDKEIEVALGMIHESASARRRGLVRKGKVKNSGTKRLSPSKREVIVWVLGKGEPVVDAKKLRPTSATIRSAVKNMQKLIAFAKDSMNPDEWTEKHLVSEDLIALLVWLDRMAAK